MATRRRGTSAQDVYAGLRDDILSGEYAPGAALIEDAVATKYEVSRTPVRSALLMLAQDGLVNMPLNGGAVVRTVTVRDITEIFELRQAVESFALEHMTKRLDRTALAELAEAYRARDDGEPMRESGPEVLLYSTETELHHLLLEGWGNERAIRTLRSHSQQIARVRALLWRAADPLIDAEIAARNVEAQAEHKQIIELILGDDIAGARSVLLRHLDLGRDNLIHLMAAADLEAASGRSPRKSSAARDARQPN